MAYKQPSSFLGGLAQGFSGGGDIDTAVQKRRRLSREGSDDIVELLLTKGMIYQETDDKGAGTGRYRINPEEFHKKANKLERQQFINHSRGAKNLFKYYETKGPLGRKSTGEMKDEVKQGFYEDTVDMPDGSVAIATKQEDGETDGQVTIGRDTDPEAEVVLFDKSEYEDILQGTLDRHVTWGKPGSGSAKELLRMGKGEIGDQRAAEQAQNEYYGALQTALDDEDLTPDERAQLLEARPKPKDDPKPGEDPKDKKEGVQWSTTHTDSEEGLSEGQKGDMRKRGFTEEEINRAEARHERKAELRSWWTGVRVGRDQEQHKGHVKNLDRERGLEKTWRGKSIGYGDDKTTIGARLDSLKEKAASGQELSAREKTDLNNLSREEARFKKRQAKHQEEIERLEQKHEKKVKDKDGNKTEEPTTDALESPLNEDDPTWTEKEIQSIQKQRAQAILDKYGVNSINELVTNKRMDAKEKRLAMQEVARHIALSEQQALGTTVHQAAKSYLTTMHNAAMTGDPNVNTDQLADNLATIQRNDSLNKNQLLLWNEKVMKGGPAAKPFGDFVSALWDDQNKDFRGDFRSNPDIHKHFELLKSTHLANKNLRATGQMLPEAEPMAAMADKLYFEAVAYLALADGARRTGNWGNGRFIDSITPRFLGGPEDYQNEGLFGGVLGSMKVARFKSGPRKGQPEFLTWVITKQGEPVEEKITVRELNALIPGGAEEFIKFLDAGGSLRDL